MLNIFIDADACPVKDETYKVADRYELIVVVVANQYLNIPLSTRIRMQAVEGDFDAADDWIVDQIEAGDLVITADLLLASRCLEKQAKVIGPKGYEFTEDNIGSALSGREVAENLRHLGQTGTGPSAMAKADRSNFLSKLDQVIQKLKAKNKR
jgi:hypothetical protein